MVGDEETRDKVIAAEVGGNQTPLWSLNAYLDKFVGIHRLLKSQRMDEEDFQTFTQSILTESKNEKAPLGKFPKGVEKFIDSCYNTVITLRADGGAQWVSVMI